MQTLCPSCWLGEGGLEMAQGSFMGFFLFLKAKGVLLVLKT